MTTIQRVRSSPLESRELNRVCPVARQRQEDIGRRSWAGLAPGQFWLNDRVRTADSPAMSTVRETAVRPIEASAECSEWTRAGLASESRRVLQTTATGILVLMAYILAGKVGLELASIHASATAVWPATGIAVSALMLCGYGVWPAIFVGAFITNETTAGTVVTSLLIAVGNTGEALLGAYLLKRFAPKRLAFDRGCDMFVLMVAAIVGAILSATVGVTTLASYGIAPWHHYRAIWLTWWLGNATGFVVVAPAVLLAATAGSVRWSPAKRVELVSLATVLIGVGWLVFVRWDYPLTFLCIPICTWAAFRFGQREAAFATCALSAMAIWGTTHGHGPFASYSTNNALLLLQSFMAAFSAVGITTATAVEGRRTAEERLRQANSDLESKVLARTCDLVLSESRLREAQELAHVGSWEWTVGDRRVWWSSELYRISGVDPGSFSPNLQSSVALLPAGDREKVEAVLAKALDDREPFQLEHRIVRSDGTVRVMNSFGRVVTDDDGRVVRIMGASQDITERKAAEERVRRSEQRLQTMLDAQPACVKLVSSDGNLLDMNRAGLEMLGAGALAHVINESVFDFVHPEDRSRCVELHQRAHGGSPGRAEFRTIGLDGSERWVDSRAVPFDTSIGGATERAVLSVTSDVTERKRLEEQLRQTQKMEAIGLLAGGIAHDFNNRLTVIRGYSDMLLSQIRSDDPIAADLEEVRQAAESAAALTRRLLIFSREEPARLQSVNLNLAITNVERLLRRTLGEHVLIDLKLSADLRAIRADMTHIEQVVMNLAVNARDAMRAGGTLTIETANVDLAPSYTNSDSGVVAGPYVRLTVNDTGHGMDAATQARLFEPFFTTKERGHGTGLGLTIVYGLIQQAGGTISVFSEVGRGTTFTLYFPQCNADAEPTEPQAAIPHAAFQGSETLLVVEDDESVRGFATRVLKQHGYRVHEASSPADALTMAADMNERLDLVLTDIVMPGMNGVEFAARLCATRPETRRLYMSGYTGRAMLPAGISIDSGELLDKPFTSTALLHKLRSILDAADVVECSHTRA